MRANLFLVILIFFLSITAFAGKGENEFFCQEGDFSKEIPWGQIGENMSAFTMTLYDRAVEETPAFVRDKGVQYGEKIAVGGLRCSLGILGGRFGGIKGAQVGQTAGKEVGEILCKYYKHGDFQKALTDQALSHMNRPIRDVTELAIMIHKESPDELVLNSAKQKAIGYIPHKGAQELSKIMLKVYEGQEPEKVAQDFLLQKAKEGVGKGEILLKNELSLKFCSDKP